MSDDLATWLRSQVDDDETLAESDYDIMISARKVRDAAAEITRLRAALTTARREGMETALRLVRHYEAVAYQHGDLPYMDPHECAAQAAREIASSIEAIIYSSVKDEPWRRACDQCGVSLPANCPADEGYGCPACETHKERDEDAIRAALEGKP